MYERVTSTCELPEPGDLVIINLLGNIAKVFDLRFETPVPLVLLEKIVLVEESNASSARFV